MNNISKINKYIRSIFSKNDWKKLLTANIVFICHDDDRSYKYEGNFYAPFMDSFRELLLSMNYKGISIAKPVSVYHGKQSFDNALQFNRSYLIHKVLSKLYFNTINFELLFWKKIIKRVKPKIIFAIQPSYSLCLACKNANVVTTDIQHGWILSGEAQNKDYYSEYNLKRNNKLALPDYFFVWDENTKRNLEGIFNSAISTIIVLGNIWFNRFIIDDASDSLVQQSRRLFPRSEKSSLILITLQWGKIQISDILTQNLREVIHRTKHKYNWMIRLHPVQSYGNELKKTLKTLKEYFGDGCMNISWHKPVDYPLPEILRKTDLHITQSSCTTLEASYMNIKTGFINCHLSLDKDMSLLFESGMAVHLKDDVRDIIKWIESSLGNKYNDEADLYQRIDAQRSESVKLLDCIISRYIKNN